MKTNLGMDQMGELHAKARAYLVLGETFTIEEVLEDVPDDEVVLTLLGSRGTNLTAHLTDKGWEVKETVGEINIDVPDMEE